MKLAIPKHLLNLTVVDQLTQMISKYNSDKEAESKIDEVIDPVKKFLYMRVNMDDDIFTSGSQDYTEVINYLTALFYSVKGTQKVLEYMIKYLGFSDKDIIYDAKSISIFPSQTGLGDDTLYYESLLGFLSELLYFEEAVTDIGASNLTVKHEVITRIDACGDIHCYKTININDGNIL